MKVNQKEYKKILIGGGSGFIGTHFRKALKQKYPKTQILNISRKSASDSITWEQLEKEGISDDVNAIFNFTGKNILSGFWTKNEKQKLIDSRINPTNQLVHLINNRKSTSQLELFCCASGTSYSFDREKTFTEEDQFDQSNFAGHLCYKWEKAANKVDPKVRLVISRFGKFFFLSFFYLIFLFNFFFFLFSFIFLF